jgi:hypothetical protein
MVTSRKVYRSAGDLEGATVFTASSTGTLYTDPVNGDFKVMADHRDPSGNSLATDIHYFWGVPTLAQCAILSRPDWRAGKELKVERTDRSVNAQNVVTFPSLQTTISTWAQATVYTGSCAEQVSNDPHITRSETSSVRL